MTTAVTHVKTTSDKEDKEDVAANPIILDFGKQKRKQIKQLREGKGRLLDEVNTSLKELRAAGNLSASAQPVIVLIREKPRKMMGPLGSWL